MSTSSWRTYAAHLRDFGHAMLHGESRDNGCHPPDLCRRTLLYDRYLR